MEKTVKPQKVTDVYGRKVTIDANKRKMTDFDNNKREIIYNAPIIDKGSKVTFYTDYKANGTINDVEEKLNTYNNPVRIAYAVLTGFASEKNDPDKKIWKKIVQYAREHEDELFTKSGNWRSDITFGNDLKDIIN